MTSPTVAIVRCDEGTRLAASDDFLLTEWERGAAASIAHDGRRAEWIAGRVAAKWLLAEGARPARSDIRRDHSGAPVVFTKGARDDTVRLSIAHRGGWAVAAVCRGGVVGVDVELVGPRQPSFYEFNMSPAERRWMSLAPTSEADRLGTLLWVLKEAALKTGIAPALTVWEIGAIELDVRVPASRIAAIWNDADLMHAGELTAVPVDIPVAGASRSSPTAAFGTMGDLVIAVVHQHSDFLEGAMARRQSAAFVTSAFDLGSDSTRRMA